MFIQRNSSEIFDSILITLLSYQFILVKCNFHALVCEVFMELKTAPIIQLVVD